MGISLCLLESVSLNVIFIFHTLYMGTIMSHQKTFLLATAINGLLAVAIGAFGAHGLQGILDQAAAKTYQTGVEYHFFHTLALFGVSQLTASRFSRLAGWSFVIGILLFSFSLYLLAITGIKILGVITPFGGTLFLIGWGCLVMHALKQE